MTPSHYQAVDEYLKLYGRQAAREFFGDLDQVRYWIFEVTETLFHEIPKSLIEQLSRECLEFLDFSPRAHEVPEKQRAWIEDLVRTHGKEVVLEMLNASDAWIKMQGWSLLTKGIELDEERQREIIEAVVSFIEGLE